MVRPIILSVQQSLDPKGNGFNFIRIPIRFTIKTVA